MYNKISPIIIITKCNKKAAELPKALLIKERNLKLSPIKLKKIDINPVTKRIKPVIDKIESFFILIKLNAKLL